MVSNDYKYLFADDDKDHKVSDENIYEFFYYIVSELNWESAYFIINMFENKEPTMFKNNDLSEIKDILNKKMKEKY